MPVKASQLSDEIGNEPTAKHADVITCGTLTSACRKSSMPERALQLFKVMQNKKERK